MTETATWVFESLWIAGILAFAISGALVGVRHNLDLLGILVVGTATGIGGGIIRDMIIGVHPPISLVVWPYWTTALLGSLVVFFFHPGLSKIRRFEIVFDAFGLGIFSAYGAAVATASGADLTTAIFVGTIVSIGGGVIRDVLVNDVPGVLTRELYAVSAILGASVATVITHFTGNLMVATIVGGVLAISLRLTSYAKGWHLPKPRPVRESPSNKE
ncbi:trimeric intracellular cation channel family protein [Leucobacter salsicius]|uniref:trimeric intracellular cation channel family protein n=1 Tax=Leucobacter salsicius TaxID=664638 RepID=UPI00034C7607|nr:TRIC cation channel family protein [Leucobacter salsicius]